MMGRKVSCESFAGLMATARASIPDVSISTDVMAGFPGESEDDFAQTAAFVRTMRFSRLHVFRYSPREGTPAAAMPNQVTGPVAAERSRRLAALGARLERDFNRRFVGSVQPVLWEDSESSGARRSWSGLTHNYIRVTADTDSGVDLTNHVTPTRLVATIPGGLAGVINRPDSLPAG
jgi:threonylcarbamoyladenosine tRNA methylthiotransferase MtaB